MTGVVKVSRVKCFCNEEVRMRSRYIQNEIIEYLSDHKRHTLSEIAEALEVSKYTVLRHIHDLPNTYMVTTYQGRYGGGVQLLSLKGKNKWALTSNPQENIVLLDKGDTEEILKYLRNCPQNEEVQKMIKKLEEAVRRE